MGKLTLLAGVTDTGADPVSYEKFRQFTTALPFDTTGTSFVRDLDKQATMRQEYDAKVKIVEDAYKAKSIDAKERDKRLAALRGVVANKPGQSAHNWGMGLDVHPSYKYTKNPDPKILEQQYQKMKDIAAEYGLVRDSVEKWHFQDNRFTRDLGQQWYDALKQKAGEVVTKAGEIAQTKEGIAGGLILAAGLTALVLAMAYRRNRMARANV
jgi:hypothetical protein